LLSFIDFFKIFENWFSLEIFFLQLFIYVLFVVMYTLTNLYAQIGFFTLICLFLGFFLAFMNFELFTMVFWLIESISVLSLLLVSMFFFASFQKYKKSRIYFLIYGYALIILVFMNYLSIFFFDSNTFNFIFILDKTLWIYYMILSFLNSTNDFLILFLHIYSINYFQFIIIGLLLFFGSIFVVFLYRYIYTNNDLKLFEFFKESKMLQNFFFFQKQNVFLQNVTKVRTFFFKAKK